MKDVKEEFNTNIKIFFYKFKSKFKECNNQKSNKKIS
jgi:hypothetical protein